MEESDTLRSQCWNNALHSFGTAYIFERRASHFRLRLRLLSFLGIIVPLLVGYIVITYGTRFKYIDAILIIGAILGLVQLVASSWALVAKWDDEYAYAQESTNANYDLSYRYQALAQNPPIKLDDFRIRLDLLDAARRCRSDLDYRHSITDAEKRKGMRAALRNYQRACATCKEVPTSMKPTKCDTCGNF